MVGAIRLLRYVSPDESGVDLAQYEISPGIFVPLNIQLDANGNPILTPSNPGCVIDATDYTQQFDYDGSGNLLYHGRATPGTPTSFAAWQIRKYTYVGSNLTAIQYATGASTFASIWDNRVSLTYS